MPFGNSPNPMMSPVVAALGLTPGDQLGKQRDDQAEELRKKKLKQQQLMGMSPAAAAIYGPLGAGLGG